MSLFKRVLSSVGIGSAKIDAVLNGRRFVPGQEVEGVIKIKGGSSELEIDEIYCALYCNMPKRKKIVEIDGDVGEAVDKIIKAVDTIREHTLTEFKIKGPFTLQENENTEIPFSFILPPETPLTMGKTKVWLSSKLDIKMALDPADRDYIQVEPNQLQKALFDAFKKLGFRLSEAECEDMKLPPSRLPFVQEFEFKPNTVKYRGSMKELEIIFVPQGHEMEVFMEIDRKKAGTRKAQERHIRWKFEEGHIPELQEIVEEILQEYA